MCGIVGYTHLHRPVSPAITHRLAATLHHRGPDQSGTHESPHCSLAAVRLSIIDLAAGDQPIYSANRDSVIVFNGEIYNHAAVRRDLEALGRRFHTHCDTEVVLQAFLEWDLAAFEKLRGMFAAAIWTESSRRLVLARDRLGIKPLYLHRRGRDVYFASELKALFEHPEVPRELDRTGLDYFLALNYVPCPWTLARGIEKLPPGTWLDWRDGEVRTGRYWTLRFAPDDSWTLGSAKEALDTLLRDAVREHLIADVPLGVWSSGGIDSSTILHYAAEAAGSLKTFSVGFAGRTFDESPWFRDIARRYGTDHHEFDLNPDVEMADAISQFATYSDEPSADAGALPVWFLSRMTRRHVTVALSGDGGDELFGGYLTYLADGYSRTLRAIPGPALSFAAHAAHSLLPVSDDKISFEYKVKRMLDGSLLSPDDAHFYWNGTNSPAARRAILPGGGRLLSDLTREIPHGTGHRNRYLEIDHHFYLPDDILYKVDRMSMAHSLEVRPPFLDHRIVEFAATLPEKLKINGSTLKYLLKELMRGRLPDSVIDRPKTGFDVPTHDWFRGPLKPLLMDTITRESARGIFNWAPLEAMITAHLDRRINAGYQLWGLMTFFLWMKRWNIQPAATKSLSSPSPPSSSSAASLRLPA